MIFNSDDFKATNLGRMDLPYLIAADLVLVSPTVTSYLPPPSTGNSLWKTITNTPTAQPSPAPASELPGDKVQQFLESTLARIVYYASNIGWSPRGHVIYRPFMHKDTPCIQAALFLSIGEGIDESTVVCEDRTVMGVLYDAWRNVNYQGDLHIAHIESYPNHDRDETGQACAIPDQETFLTQQGWEWGEGDLRCVDYDNDFIGWYYY